MSESRRDMAPTKPTVFVDDIFEISEDGNTFRAIALSGSEVYSFRFSPHTTLKAIELLQRAYGKWAAANELAQGIRTRGER